MAVTVIILTHNRPAQLDLLLHSIEENARGLIGELHVIWRSSRNAFNDGYRTAQAEWPTVRWLHQFKLDQDVVDLLQHSPEDGHVMFLTDDSVFYRAPEGADPTAVLDENPHVLCFSLRLGRNTTECYPLRRHQATPGYTEYVDHLVWRWRVADADYGYPGSVDGHIFRREDLLWFLDTAWSHHRPDWMSPNQIEVGLMEKVMLSQRELMACHERSSLVGIPVNRASATHEDNRAAETHAHPLLDLNTRYLAGERLSPDGIDPAAVNAAHAEFPLAFA